MASPAKIKVEDHLKLVACIARDYVNRGLEFDDLVQSGCIGLIRAVAKANAGREWKPSYWIKEAIRSAVIDEGSAIATPAWAYKQVGRWLGMESRLGRPVPMAEAASAFSWNQSWTEMIADARRARTAPTRRITRLGHAAVGEDFVPIFDAVDDDECEAAGPELVWLRSALDRLSPSQQSVLRSRYGLDDGVEWQAKEIADKTGMRFGTVTKTEYVALARLRAMSAEASA